MGFSILKYGSCVRGNSDRYSDKDILVVSENFDELNLLKKYYSSLGWSVSAYTYSKLDYLSKNGYLFVKHLIDEGEIQLDYDNRLLNIFSDFRERLDYEEKLQESANFIDFVSEIPDNTISYSWLCDNIYVTLRNFLIYKSAINKEFKFGYVDLISQLSKEGNISLQEEELLLQLRVLKSCYRNNYDDIVPSKKYVENVTSLVNKLGLRVNLRFSDKLLSLDNVDFEKIESPYKKLRLLELILKDRNIDNEYLNKCIFNPQMYATNKSIDKVYKKVIFTIKELYSINNPCIIPKH
ncbi:nucleotidyltransferase domain-containing protein [Capnocytophaga cynodegmi]|uniref:nucleotidyltransferase domain-containing protein n=1 Tax=Capnocytophaga cynodegmi TaxID=28189 RepID=UPI00385B7407